MSVYVGTKKIKQCAIVVSDGMSDSVKDYNIKKDITILGITGSYTADGTQTAGQDLATSADIVSGKSAWADGEEVLGNLEVNKFYVGTEAPPSNLGKNGDVYLRR